MITHLVQSWGSVHEGQPIARYCDSKIPWWCMEMKNPLTVLLTGAGAPGAPGVTRSLRSVDGYNFRIIGVDINPNASGRVLVDDFFACPPAVDQEYIPEMVNLCRQERVDVVMPMVTAELIPLARARELFHQVGTVVSVSDAPCLENVIHKGKLYRALEDVGMAVPRYVTVRTVDQLKKAVQELGYPSQPVCFKPVTADGSRGFRILDSSADRAHHLFYGKPNSTHISYTELLNVLDDVADIPELLVMEYLPGEEYSVDILSDCGRVLVAVPRLREVTVNGITTRGSIRQETDVMDYAATVVEKLGLHGNIGVQVRRDTNGQPRILEVNPRLQGTIVHCTAAGVNLPFLAVKLAMGQSIPPNELDIRWGTRMTRYWSEVFFDSNGSAFLL